MSTLHYGRRFIVVDIDIWRAANLLIKQHGEMPRSWLRREPTWCSNVPLLWPARVAGIV